jgi:polar amino acid transport system substrate-binding protein
MRSVARRTSVAAGIVALTLSAAACSSSSSGGSQTVTSGSGVSKDSKAAALVPSAVRSKGSLTVAADASYAPNEFLASNGTTVEGMDADLAQAIGKVLGLSVKVQNATFNAIIPGIVDGRYDLGMSSFTDNKLREQQVNFVTYFSAGTSFFEKAQGGPPVTGLSSLCGLTVAVESGTTQESDAKSQSSKCAGGKSVKVLSFNTQSQANLALNAGRAQVGMADSPIAAYQVKQSNGAFKVVGTSYGTAPYGIATPKSGTLDQAVLAAVKDLMADGTYNKIMTKWGIQAGEINNPVINGAIS